MIGRGNNEFAPQNASTRAEAAKVVSMLIDKVESNTFQVLTLYKKEP